jgi:UDPglucose--hexose-1-phosphate uridylyltransferase
VPERAVPPATQAELDACPFCAGREDRTPPETLRLPVEGPWQVRVVPNLYPAVERQEVVVHAPRHVRSLAELSDDEAALVAEAWQRRARDVPGYVHALVNEGAGAGSSLPHSHSQLAWLDAIPPEVARELPALEGDCALCRSPGDELVVAERGGVRSWVRHAGRLPYESVIAPAGHAGDPWSDPRLEAALQLASELVRRLHKLEGPRPLNLWLHAGGHWHLELLPRLSVLAGLELGAGIYVNALRPEDAAARLRDT